VNEKGYSTKYDNSSLAEYHPGMLKGLAGTFSGSL
jgi:hypothetical protein